MATYRTYQNLDPFYEAVATFKIGEVAWVGGGYRQNYGAFPFFGVNIKQKLRVGYAYEIATNQTDKMGNGSHEVQVVFRLSKKQHIRVQPSAQKTAVQPEQVTPAQTTIEPVETTPKPVVDQVSPVAPIATERVAQPNNNAPQNNVAQQNIPTNVVKDQPKPITNLKGEGLAPGHYVVVGIFNSGQNALTYLGTLKRAGYPANVAYDPSKNRYVVHMEQPSDDIDHARKMRDKYRQMSRYSFRDTWILTIE